MGRPVIGEHFEIECFDELPMVCVPPCHLPVNYCCYTAVLDYDVVRSKVPMIEYNPMLVCINHATDVGTDLTFGFGDEGVGNRSTEVFFALKRT